MVCVGKTILIDATAEMSIFALKKLVQDKEEIPAERQNLIFAGKFTDDYKSLKDYQIQQESTLHMTLRR